MNVESGNLSKAALRVLVNIDKYLSAYEKSKNGRKPELMTIHWRDYGTLYTSATKKMDKKDKPKEIFYKGIKLVSG